MRLDALAPPALDHAFVRQLLETHFGIQGPLEDLPGERDRNYKVTTPRGQHLVFKVAAPDEGHEAFAMQAALLRHLERVDESLPVPRVHAAVQGGDVVAASGPDGEYLLRLVSWIPGTALASVKSRSPGQLEGLGRLVGRVSRALRSFGHAGAHRELEWDLRATPACRDRLDHIRDADRRALIEKALAEFDGRVAPRLRDLRHGVVHGDPNDWNVLVDPDATERVTGLIDVGDALHSIVIADVAIACTYAMLGAGSPWIAAGHIAKGAHEAFPLEALELELLPDLICGRLCTSLTMSAARRALAGEANSYWYVSEAPAWELLERLSRDNRVHAVGILRNACGFEAAPDARKVARWLAATEGTHHPILARPLQAYDKRLLDWSDPGDPVVKATIAGDTRAADIAYGVARAAAGFDVGLGAWGEERAIYSTAAFASRLLEGARRRVHLGLDLFADAGTALHTPLAARVVAKANCARPQDYGGTLLLEHETDDGTRFLTLWGHLAPASLEGLRAGQRLERGAVVGRLGDSMENGGWVPHLHLQLVCAHEHDPETIIGVGEPELLDVWRDLYPDPSALAALPPEALDRDPPTLASLLERRQHLLGMNLSLAYRSPLHIVRGRDVWLYDATGRAWLDCYNNVAHVGHCHPAVVDAIANQAGRLNTNTRYLHELILEYAERLTSTLPAPLSVCYFVSSGSEANELALRLVRAHTGRRDLMVLDWGYHGSSSALVEISPYKYKRRGGGGRPAHVFELPVPDPYRAPADWPAESVGHRYAEAIGAALLQGATPGALIAETIPSCAGQVVVPKGFFSIAFESVRAAGGLCVLDEVQVGFGRVGTSMWAFEEHGVVPDVVTLGKPIGNGHPLGAVVTTPEIAASFAAGPEYFSTFGGNPVSCAAGLAVLDVLEREGLLANASARGSQLQDGLRLLQGRHEAIGDVRGRGLFLGVELVRDRASREPHGRLAGDVVNRCRDLGVLLGTDGPSDNVIKIRPPLTIRAEQARELLEALDRALEVA